MSFFEANFELLRMKEIFKGDVEWEKGLALFHCLTLRDRETAEHSLEVAYIAAKLAEALSKDPGRFFLAGLMHDIGKINMNDNPLKTSHVLKKKEREILQNHVLHGVLTLSELGFGRDVVEFCSRHHERLDGSGYPFAVDKNNIGVEGRIAMIADVFSALTNPRLYRENQRAYSYKEALEILRKDVSASKMDRHLFAVFEEIIVQELSSEKQYA